MIRWLCASLLLLTGCNPASILNATVGSGDVVVTRDVAYAPGPRGTLDIYRPARPAGPLVVFLYGGSWRTGDKAMFAFVARPLARRGAVVVIPDYRMFPEIRFPAFIEDNAAATAWAIANAAALGADPARVFVVGHSAGAYDAAMLALDPSYLAAAGSSRDRLAGVVGMAGPYDFLPSTDPDVIPVFGPANIPANDAVSHVDGRNPPLLLLHGDEDTVVRPRNTESLLDRVRQAGGPVDAKTYPGVGHVGLVIAFAPLFAGKAPVLDDVWAFMQRPPATQRP